METMVEKMMIADYIINYHGRTMDISTLKSDHIYYLFKSGSGYTGYMGRYYGTEYGELYQSNGKELILVGQCSTYYGGETSSKITLKGVTFELPLSADDLFTNIFKKG
jgi:hypothetical protein